MNPEVLILGGGLAGSAAAIRLARADRSVVLVEREATAQHKVCGEFLSAEALIYLQALGLDAAALGAVPIDTVQFGSSIAPLPFAAMSLTRRRLDEALLSAAIHAGVNVRRPCTVRALGRIDARWHAELDDGSTLAASTVFLATGKHDLRGWPRPSGKQSDLVAFKMYFRLNPQQMEALRNRVELILFRGGYGGLQLVEGDAANLCCLVQRRWLKRVGGNWDSLLLHMRRESPQLTERLANAMSMLDKPLAISSIPYGYVRHLSEPDLWCLGDQAAVIPSFTGDGMSIALHSGCLAAEMYLAGATSAQFQRRLHDQLKQQVGFATWLSRGMVNRPACLAMSVAVRLWPGALGYIASRTRVRNLLELD